MTNTSKIKVRPSYWLWMTKRPPRLGDSHTQDGVLYTVAEITASGMVVLSRRNIRKGYR